MTMLRITRYILPLLLLLMIGQGCRKSYFFTGINDDPSALKNPTPNVLLPSVILQTAYIWGGDASRYSALFMQQVTGVANQSANANNYNITPDDVDNMWYAGFYGAIMTNIDTLIKISASRDQVHYEGMGKVLLALNLGQVTDFWGDVPYSEAFRGLDTKQPKFDSQQEVYATLHRLLDEGITALEGPDESVSQPGSDDLLFGGDTEMWVRFAHSLKARLYLHTVKVDNSSIANGLAELADGFTEGEFAGIKFLGTDASTTQAPWYQFNTQRADIAFDSYLNTLMDEAGDPRHDAYFDGSDLGELYGSPNSTVYFITYDELKFIEAELQLRASNPTGAAAAYNAAVTANLRRTINNTAYAATVARTPANITLQSIIDQKYIALFLSPEVWTDWRRTGFPVLTAPSGSVLGGELPRSLFYPSSEVRYNSNTPPNTRLTRRVWWDVQ
jgi:hypothetical protein